MNKKISFLGVILVAGFFVTGLNSCTAMASNDQLRMLEETRKAAESTEADLRACKSRRAELERQLAQKKQIQAEWQQIHQSVKQGLGQ